MGRHPGPDGLASAACYTTPVAVNTKRASWTLRPEAVTCTQCRKIIGLPSLAALRAEAVRAKAPPKPPPAPGKRRGRPRKVPADAGFTAQEKYLAATLDVALSRVRAALQNLERRGLIERSAE